MYVCMKVSPERLQQGCCFPPLEDIRAVSLHIAASVAKNIVADGRSSRFKAAAGLSQEDLLKLCKELMYEPEY